MNAKAEPIVGARELAEVPATDFVRGSDPLLPRAEGLYDPANEKDSCGVGFVADMKNRKSHAILEKGLQILVNLDHRGAVGADPTLGDGCGVLTQIPHRFFAEECARLGMTLPEPGHYAIGQFFMPRDAEARAQVTKIVEEVVASEGQRLIGWREVPVDSSCLGARVRAVEPVQMQAFIARSAAIADDDAFDLAGFAQTSENRDDHMGLVGLEEPTQRGSSVGPSKTVGSQGHEWSRSGPRRLFRLRPHWRDEPGDLVRHRLHEVTHGDNRAGGVSQSNGQRR